MSYIRRVAPVVFLTVVACAGGRPTDLTDAERTAIEGEIRRASEEWRDAAERLDAKVVMNGYINAPDTVIFRADNSMVSLNSFEERKNQIETGFRTFQSQEIAPRFERIDVLARDVAAESATGDWMQTSRTGTIASMQFAFKWQMLHSFLDVRPVANPAEGQATRR
jgi:ketosteroid isomerase-like protein